MAGKGRNVMMTQIDRNEVKRLVSQKAQLVEVLPKAEYEQEHLPGAMHIFLKQLDRKSAAELKREQPLIVYCHDYQ
jgi:rhodanese-related sulfurtransferase